MLTLKYVCIVFINETTLLYVIIVHHPILRSFRAKAHRGKTANIAPDQTVRDL